MTQHHTVHPRVCRERQIPLLKFSILFGSSPRMQGTAAWCVLVRVRPRFIPAYAGNGLIHVTTWWYCSVHPRVCRERLNRFRLFRGLVGSSPRMQGTVYHIFLDCLADRFIPAYAGNGSIQARDRHREAVHPRVCRERFITSFLIASQIGSSPRMQGTGFRALDEFSAGRFIPAYAGNGDRRRLEKQV